MARFTYALISYIFSTGQFPNEQRFYEWSADFVSQIFLWIFWLSSVLVSYLLHPLWYHIFRFFIYHLWWLNLIFPEKDKFFEFLVRLFTKKKDTPHRPTRHWKCHRFNGDRLFRLRSSLLVFGAIMIYDSEAYLFADSVSSDTRSQITKAFQRSYLVLHFPWSWIERHTPEYPPNGWILHCVFITMICGITFSIIVRGYVRMLYLKWTNYTLDSSTPHDNGGATFQSSPVSFTTITTAFSTKDAVSTHIQGRVSFDSDLIQFVLDNCANVHIINDRELFEFIVATSMSGVATIGGDPLTPQGQGSCHIYIKDDLDKVVPLTLHNALYFPDSPVNIISISRLADSYDDDEGTFVKTTRFQSEFSWDFGKHFKTISH